MVLPISNRTGRVRGEDRTVAAAAVSALHCITPPARPEPGASPLFIYFYYHQKIVPELKTEDDVALYFQIYILKNSRGSQ
jgi:hypothetical protein